jgi:hypothetical protein
MPHMRRIIRLFRREPQQVRPWTLSEQQHRQVLDLLSEIGLGIVAEGRGPVPLMKFGQRVLERLDQHARPEPVPLAHFADALKRVITEMRDDRLRVMSPTDFIGVGYVYNAHDPETWPYRGSIR